VTRTVAAKERRRAALRVDPTHGRGQSCALTPRARRLHHLPATGLSAPRVWGAASPQLAALQRFAVPRVWGAASPQLAALQRFAVGHINTGRKASARASAVGTRKGRTQGPGPHRLDPVDRRGEGAGAHTSDATRVQLPTGAEAVTGACGTRGAHRSIGGLGGN
jgi:hypothetical protein